jgi:hypothetical protein
MKAEIEHAGTETFTSRDLELTQPIYEVGHVFPVLPDKQNTCELHMNFAIIILRFTDAKEVYLWCSQGFFRPTLILYFQHFVILWNASCCVCTIA